MAAILPGRYSDFEAPLEELSSLVATAGGEVVGQLTQRLDRPHPRTYFGKGKFEEATAVFPGDKRKELIIQWEVPGVSPKSVIVHGTQWKTAKGIGIGMLHTSSFPGISGSVTAMPARHRRCSALPAGSSAGGSRP